MTEKLYYQNGHLARFTARVLSCARDEKGWAVKLDRTAFFPGGGGQEADEGTLAGQKLLSLREEGEDIIHVVEEPLAPGEAVMRNGVEILLPLAALFGLALAASIAAPAMLGSLGWRGKALGFKGSRMNPLSGLKRMFGPQGAVELIKSLAKVLLLGTIGYFLVADAMPQIMGLAQSDLQGAIGMAGKAIGHAMLAMAGGLVVIALIDVPAQWFQRNRRLMMSKQEVKEEARESDGAPELKQAQRQRAHEILSGSARKAVSDATVVLTNPTHFSVALRYRPGVDAAPVVVARGRGDVALSIRELARGANVPILEYPQLARAIYFTARAGRVIPEELFVAVATVLAFVFQLERAVADRIVQPAVDVPPSHHFDPEGRRQA